MPGRPAPDPGRPAVDAAVDPQLLAVARDVLAHGPGAWTDRRSAAEEALAAEALAAGLPVPRVVDLLVPTDPPVPVRLFRPRIDRPVPALVFAHGGGFTAGDAAALDRFCADIAARIDIAVANVDYRLAPATPFPGPVEDCYAALRQVHGSSAELGLDPTRLAIGGASSGAALAAATALLARDRGEVPLVFQLLDVPLVDDRLATASAARFTTTPGLTGAGAAAAWDAYLGPRLRRGDADVPAHAAPGRATDLAGLPPAYVATMQLDPLRDEGIDYARRLMAAGVRVELHCFPGTFHGSETVAPLVAVSRRAAEERLRALAAGLSVTPDGRVRAGPPD